MENPIELFLNEFKDVKGLLHEIIDQSKFNHQNKFYNTEEAGEILRVDPQTVRDYIKKGKVKAKKNGRNYLIKHSELFGNGDEVKSLKFKR